MALHLEIVTPEKKIFSDIVEDVYLPASEGEMGVLELHAAMVSALVPGELRYLKEGKIEEMAIGKGFVEVTQEKVVVLTDMALGDAEIDETSVEEAMQRAEKALEGSDVDPGQAQQLQVLIANSMAQLNLKKKHR